MAQYAPSQVPGHEDAEPRQHRQQYEEQGRSARDGYRGKAVE